MSRLHALKLTSRPSKSYGIPNFRTRVQYVPQRPALLPGTPLMFLDQARKFAARQKRCAELEAEGKAIGDPIQLAEEWGIQRIMWAREWGTLSGGESQRIAMAIAIGLGGADVLLLDGESPWVDKHPLTLEPTSALDPESALAVEKTLISMLPPAPISAPNVRSRRQNITDTKGSATPRKGTGPRALLWITHSPEQGERVGTRSIDLTHR